MIQLAEFPKCPYCGSTRRLMKSIVDEEVSKGNMGNDVVPNTATKVITNIDGRRPPIAGGRVPSARVFYDICLDCGRERVVRIEKGHVTIPARSGVPPTFA